ncbi:hypothetical protein BB560_002551 [Smittium megazygosporum]|uniref:Uncharacterized protein n=1 Tax=Smittium megazygosporum TaxID=133381 RepID=A0A2T9ZEI7_9FUNG|nr:hypothetical protein BB560_002551 [Smittium megazygosporum]
MENADSKLANSICEIKDHSKCSESFYKDQIQSEISQEKPSKEEIQHITKIINDHYEDLIQGSDIQSKLVEKIPELEKNNFDFRSIWNVLEETERKEFEELVSLRNKSSAFDLLELATSNFSPWWEATPALVEYLNKTEHEPEKYLEYVNESLLQNQSDPVYNNQNSIIFDSDDKQSRFFEPTPQIFVAIPEFSSLSKSTPNISVYYNMLGLLLVYAMAYRTFQAEMDLFYTDSIQYFGSTSPFIFDKSAPIFQSFEESLVLCLQSTNNIEAKLVYLNDLLKILEYPSGALLALSDLYDFFLKANEHFEAIIQNKDISNMTKTGTSCKYNSKHKYSGSEKMEAETNLITEKSQKQAKKLKRKLFFITKRLVYFLSLCRYKFELSQDESLLSVKQTILYALKGYINMLTLENRSILEDAKTMTRVGAENSTIHQKSKIIEIIDQES